MIIALSKALSRHKILNMPNQSKKARPALALAYSGCQKNVPVFKRFFLQPYKRLYPNSVIRNIIMESGIISLQHDLDIFDSPRWREPPQSLKVMLPLNQFLQPWQFVPA